MTWTRRTHAKLIRRRQSTALETNLLVGAIQASLTHTLFLRVLLACTGRVGPDLELGTRNIRAHDDKPCPSSQRCGLSHMLPDLLKTISTPTGKASASPRGGVHTRTRGTRDDTCLSHAPGNATRRKNKVALRQKRCLHVF